MYPIHLTRISVHMKSDNEVFSNFHNKKSKADIYKVDISCSKKNLAKMNSYKLMIWLESLVGPVDDIYPVRETLRVICEETQAQILTKLNHYEGEKTHKHTHKQ